MTDTQDNCRPCLSANNAFFLWWGAERGSPSFLLLRLLNGNQLNACGRAVVNELDLILRQGWSG